jgi:hypothetical protein
MSWFYLSQKSKKLKNNVTIDIINDKILGYVKMSFLRGKDNFSIVFPRRLQIRAFYNVGKA